MIVEIDDQRVYMYMPVVGLVMFFIGCYVQCVNIDNATYDVVKKRYESLFERGVVNMICGVVLYVLSMEHS